MSTKLCGRWEPRSKLNWRLGCGLLPGPGAGAGTGGGAGGPDATPRLLGARWNLFTVCCLPPTATDSILTRYSRRISCLLGLT